MSARPAICAALFIGLMVPSTTFTQTSQTEAEAKLREAMVGLHSVLATSCARFGTQVDCLRAEMVNAELALLDVEIRARAAPLPASLEGVSKKVRRAAEEARQQISDLGDELR